MADSTEAATANEVRAAIEALTPHDIRRLALIGRAFAGSLGNQGGDLVNEALLRALDGRRRWKAGAVAFLPFLIQVMRSLRREYFADPKVDADADVGTTTSPSPNAERALNAVQTLEACEGEFAEDHEVLLLIQGLREEKSGTEIANDLGMTRGEYETVRRRMTRHLARLKPTRRRTGAQRANEGR